MCMSSGGKANRSSSAQSGSTGGAAGDATRSSYTYRVTGAVANRSGENNNPANGIRRWSINNATGDRTLLGYGIGADAVQRDMKTPDTFANRAKAKPAATVLGGSAA